MKKYLLFQILFLCFSNYLFSQGVQQRTWSDGYPQFSNVVASDGVIVDSAVKLIPQYNTQPADSFQFVLYGEDGIWPIQKFPINAAYDIDLFATKSKLFYLVCDGYGRKILEINYTNPALPTQAFSFSGNKLPLLNPVDASIFYENGERKILIADNTGNRVIKVDREGADEEWVYGDSEGKSGRGFNQLAGPTDAVAIPNSTSILICDQGNSRVIEVNPENNEILHSFGEVDKLNPTDIEYDTTTGYVLITDIDNHRVILVNMVNDSIMWRFGNGEASKTDSTLNSPTDADLLANGNILICDAGNGRLLEVDRQKNIVWSFKHRYLKNLRDADRLPDNRTIIVANYKNLLANVPIWLGYSDSLFISEPQVLDKKVNFDYFIRTAEVPAGTQIKLQFRSAANRTDLLEAPWYGPDGTESYFTTDLAVVDPEFHSGHTQYQFRAFLNTDSPLNTPSLNNLQLRYHFYDTENEGTITSPVIRDSANMIITGWQFLDFKTIQQETRNVKISILDAENGNTLKDFYAIDLDTVTNQEALTLWEEELNNIQAIQLKATLSTNNSSTTPILENWKIGWNSTMSTLSTIEFINAEEQSVDYYRASNTYPPNEQMVDRVLVRLNDLNLASFEDAVTLKINALQSNDELDVLLEKDPEDEFVLKHGIPLVIFNLSIPNNTFLEVFDGDTLTISYTDPTNPLDQCADTVRVIQNSIGKLQIVDRNITPVDTFEIGDSLFVSVTGETDHNITSLQDTIWIDILNNETDDVETLPLIELPGENSHFSTEKLASITSIENVGDDAQYSTGNFISAYGLPIVPNSTGVANDRKIQTMPANEIAAKYIDNVTLQVVVYIKSIPIPIDSTIGFPHGLIDFDVAPNPFYVSRNSNFRLRAASSIGHLFIKRVEIFNISGQKVRTISGNGLNLNLSMPIPQNVFAISENWWDLKNDNGNDVSSGTYWIKMYGYFAGSDNTQELIEMKKMIIIR